MRMLGRIAVVLAVLGVVGLAGIAIFLPRIADSDAVKSRLRTLARDALGREVSWDGLSVGLFPPRLVAEGPSVAAPNPKDPPQLEADHVDLRVALLPLFARSLVIDSLEIEGVTLRLVRSASGISLPGLSDAEAPTAERDDTAASGKSIGFALRQLRLRDSQIEFDDRVVKPAVLWKITQVDASLRGTSLEAPLQLELSAQLGSGGRIRVVGEAGLDGKGNLKTQLEAVRFDSLGPYLGIAGLAGLATGTLDLAGELANPERLAWDLKAADAKIAQADTLVSGAITTQGTLNGGFERGTGSFTADASGAELRYGTALHKPAGKRAVLSGQLEATPKSGLVINSLKLKLDAGEANGRLQTGARTQLELQAGSFDLASLATLLPGLADLKPAGRLELQPLTLRTDPLDLRGQFQLSPLRLALPGRSEELALNGGFEAKGASIESRALSLTAARQNIPLEVSLSDLAGTPRYRLRADAQGADLDALLQALTSAGGKISGALNSQLNLAGPLGGTQSALQALTGTARIEIRDGQLRGVSLLRASMNRLGAIAEVGLLLASIKRGESLQRFYEDSFESISGTFQVAGGRARSEDLKLVYKNYTVDAQGSYGLEDSALDFRGTLSIDREISRALTPGETPPAEPALERRVIPLAHVGGTLSAPKVEIARAAALAFASGVAARRAQPGGRLEQKIDERLGTGAGGQVRGALEQILGGGQKAQPPAPANPPATTDPAPATDSAPAPVAEPPVSPDPAPTEEPTPNPTP